MKVVLTQDVAKIGRRFSVVEVPDGYALNKLIPQRLAEPATPANIKRVEAMAKKQADSAADASAAFAAAVERLKGHTVTVSAKANTNGGLFEALKPEDIVNAVKTELALAVEPSWITISTPIKALGEHTVLMEHDEAQGEFTLNVVTT